VKKTNRRLKLYGFNNLTKTLSFNFYDICYAKTNRHREEYLRYIDETYSAGRLTQVLTDVAALVGAKVLNVAHQDYEPRGASVTMLISEEPELTESIIDNEDIDDYRTSIVAHLDKSHITAHTYPESHPDGGISTFRADIDVSTCGRISPLKALNFLISSFDEDIVIMDYRVRGFTRDVKGKKYYIDHSSNSIQDFLSRKTKQIYQMIDVNVYQENIFHTKMMLRNFDIDNYLFGQGKEGFSNKELTKIEKQLKKEMTEIFYGTNIN